MHATNIGRILFALSFACLGILSLASGDFALNWQPVPAWVPWRVPLAYASGAMLLAGGLGLIVERTAARAALLLTANMVIWLLGLRLPRVVASPETEVMWLGFGETLTLVVGGWLLCATETDHGATAAKKVRFARLLFGAALIPIGVSHLAYARATADLVPAWLPNRTMFAYLTGTAHIAAGVGIVLSILPRLAAVLEAIMLGLFALLVWAPRIAAAPTTRLPATAFLITVATSGAAWIVAGTLDGLAWLGARRRQAPSASRIAVVGSTAAARRAGT